MSSSYPPTPSFGGRYSPSQQWPPCPTSTTPGDAPDAYHPQNPIPPPPPTYATTNPSFKPSTQIPGLSGNNNASIPLTPSFHFMPPFQQSLQPDPYAPAFAAPMGFPQQPTTSHPQQNGLAENVSPIRTGATRKEYGKTAALDPMDSPQYVNLGGKEEGGLSNGDTEEEESSGPDGYQNHQPKEDIPEQPYLSSQQPNENHKGHSDVGTHGRLPFSHQSLSRQQSPEGPQNSMKARRHQFPQTNNITSGSSREDMTATDLAADIFAGGSVQDKLASRDPRSLPMAKAGGSCESLPVSSIQSVASHDKMDITTNGSGTYPFYGKSPAQLRVQAQGALLGLAPHNIKFDELVNEGIDPVILKRLYDEIGLKVISTRDKQQADTSQSKEMMTTSVARSQVPLKSEAESVTTPVSHAAPGAVAKSPVCESVRDKPQLSNPQMTQGTSIALAAESSKPMERKDIIARMLASKAGKPASTTDSTKSEAAKKLMPLENPPLAHPNDTSAPAKVGAPPSPKHIANETRAKEKNKAQTELARQRMQQLKQQGLGRNQTQSAIEAPVVDQQLPLSSSLVRSSQNSTPPSQPSKPPLSLNHPLPSRPPVPNPSSTARIPGLFMTSSEPLRVQGLSISNKNSVPSTEPPSTKIRAPRKRPRASDFTDEPDLAPQKTQEKRVASTQHKVIIDISEDEFMYGSDDEASEPKRRAPEPPVVRSGRNSISSQLLSRDIPPLSDFPSRNHSRRSTPPAFTAQLRNRGKDPDDLNAELKAMRQRIAEYEKRKKEKQSASQVGSPAVLAPSATTSAGGNGSIAPQSQWKPTMEAELPMLPSSQPKSSPAHSTCTEKILNSGIETSLNSDGALRSQSVLSQNSIEPMQSESIRKKIMRKKEIEAGLPELEAELQKSEARLRQFREEEQRLLAQIEKGKEGKRLLVEELEALGFKTAGQSIEELQVTKNLLENAVEALPQSTPQETPADSILNAQESTHREIARDSGSAPSLQPSTKEQTVSQCFETVPKTSQEAIDMRMSPPKETDVRPTADMAEDGTTCSSSAMDESMGSTQDMLEVEKTQEEPQALEEKGQSRSGANAHSSFTDLDVRLCESSMSPRPLHIGLEYGQSGHSLAKPDNSEESMSYRESSAGSDRYEPPEPDPRTVHTDHIQTSPFNLILPDEVEHVAAESSSISQDVNALTLAAQGSVTDPNSDSLKVKEGAEGAEGEEGARRYFTPYSSPLKLFKAYRYHPCFTKDISGGYRSLTYSHKIDPYNYICLYEAAGGFCNDHSCEYQHFRDMILSDDKILREMGSLREGKTLEEQEEYLAGLKQTINDMRRDNVKDLNTVATEIAGYRRRFLHDPSRVLAL
ncbi:conserved hypothetical protein [Histoplasma capsulatum var. duboisii H88]|uniref:Putative zinc-finger domain-containing protein n=1 Tax=Ajellomyces capsulatus (strain H88) TaxID=544711 RepID=F0UM37_AJEC8|nr:conserved hypothetical protein [Histoplasma capsulatum var. duboisii H88]